jgi:hypothetical protein
MKSWHNHYRSLAREHLGNHHNQWTELRLLTFYLIALHRTRTSQYMKFKVIDIMYAATDDRR